MSDTAASLRAQFPLLAAAPDLYDITIFGAEPRGNYNRILLSPLLGGEMDRAQIELHALQWYADRGITLYIGDPVVSIDRRQRRVMSRRVYAAGRQTRRGPPGTGGPHLGLGSGPTRCAGQDRY